VYHLEQIQNSGSCCWKLKQFPHVLDENTEKGWKECLESIYSCVCPSSWEDSPRELGSGAGGLPGGGAGRSPHLPLRMNLLVK